MTTRDRSQASPGEGRLNQVRDLPERDALGPTPIDADRRGLILPTTNPIQSASSWPASTRSIPAASTHVLKRYRLVAHGPCSAPASEMGRLSGEAVWPCPRALVRAWSRKRESSAGASELPSAVLRHGALRS